MLFPGELAANGGAAGGFRKRPQGLSARGKLVLCTPFARGHAVALLESPRKVELVGIAAFCRDFADAAIGMLHEVGRFGQAQPDDKFLRGAAGIFLKDFAEIAAVELADIRDLFDRKLPALVAIDIVDGFLDVKIAQLARFDLPAG